MDALEAALKYASMGWLVLPVRGKVPFAGEVTEWQAHCSADVNTVPNLFNLVPFDGVGVLLGERSGIIDFDCDTPKAEETFAAIFDGIEFQTPTFQSTKGKHRLFRWTADLPQKAVFRVDELEIRVGANTAQTVFPPSGGRQWIVPPTVPVADLPAEVIARIKARIPKRPSPPAIYCAPDDPGDDRLDVPRWLEKHGIPIYRVDVTGDEARRWYIPCPGVKQHTSANAVRDCCVTQEQDGRLGGCCFHQKCGMADWAAIRDAIGGLSWADFHEPVEINHVAVDAIINGSNGKHRPLPPKAARFEFPAECLHPGGIIERIVEHNLSTALCPMPVIALSGALALMSVLTGRKIKDKRNLRTNAYYVALAPASSGKNHARKINTKILATLGHPELIGPSKLKSSSGLVSALAEYPARLFQLDEMSRLLQTMKNPHNAPHLYDISTVMLEAWGEADTTWLPGAYADSKKNPIIDQPHLVVYGTAVPGDFWNSVTKSNLSDGLLGRMMVFEHAGYPKDNESDPSDFPQALLNEVLAWIKFTPAASGNLNQAEAVEVQYTKEAWDIYARHRRDITERDGESDERAGVWRRTAEKTGKLALLSACSRRPPLDGFFPTVEAVDIEWAKKLSNWLTRSLLWKAAKFVAENDHEDNLNRIMRTMQDWTSREKLGQKIRWLRAEDREKIIRNAVRDGLIDQRERESDGSRKITEYRANYEPEI